MRFSTRPLHLAGMMFVLSCSALADVKLPEILGEHMVLQRDVPVHIWGKAAPAEAVTVTFRGEVRTATTDPLGRWSVYLSPGKAGGPFDLTIQGTNTIAFKDVLVGDVWVSSGQSNMEWRLSQAANGPAEVAAAKYPKVRLMQIAKKVSDYPLEDAVVRDRWAECTPETAAAFSAVQYFFGRHLQERQPGIPLGLIHSSWGGTPVEAWTSLRAIAEDSSLMPVFAEWARIMEAYPTAQIQYERRLQTWEQAAAKAKEAGTAPPPRPALAQTSPGGAFTPAGLYNAMIAPLTQYPIRGALWYQGETNASATRAPIYGRIFQSMIRDWRRAWGVGDFPFLYVQLANYRANPWWPEVRESQRQALTLANTAMAVTIDIGNPTNIHPTNKQDVGLRLALAARAISYGEKIEYSGPLFRQATAEGSAMRVWFDHVGGGLTAKGGTLKGFEVAGADRKFVPAEGKVDGSSVLVMNATVTAPMYVRYAWADNPDCNLYNAEGLPASPFRTGE